MSHLYIMQNHLGFIKIGRSVNVEARRRALERADVCSIATVAIFEDAGENEEAMLLNLGAFNLIGEWFEGDDLCRECVVLEAGSLSEALGCEPPKIVWPYALASDEAAKGWLELCQRRRTEASVDKQFDRRIRQMSRDGASTAEDSLRFQDGEIWTLIWRFEKQESTIYCVDTGKEGEIVLTGYRDSFRDGESIPNYTRDIAAAMQLWPDGQRPKTWKGSAWDCCIAALKARKVDIQSRRIR